jgi:hypothetical protein
MIKVFLRLIITILFMTAVAVGILVWGLVQEPDFYQEVVEIDLEPEKRIEVIEQIEQQAEDLAKKIETDDQWTEKFTQQKINLWLEDELKKQFPDLIPPEFSEPRIQFKKEEINLGFRLKHKDWKGVVSLKLKPWISKPNQLAIEISSINAGIIPMPLETIMDEVKKELVKAGWKIESGTKDENEILYVFLESVIPRHPILEKLLITDGELEISVRHLPEKKEEITPDNIFNSPEFLESILKTENEPLPSKLDQTILP